MTTNVTGVISDEAPWGDVLLRYGTEGQTKPTADLGNKELGNLGEDLAAQYLAYRGYEILERNWRSPFGEADIIAEDDGVIVLVEVKTRHSPMQGPVPFPELAVDARKRGRYRKLALLYLAKQTRIDTVRFDVVAVNVLDDRTASLRHLRGAFEWDY